jgi:hypothetical protein
MTTTAPFNTGDAIRLTDQCFNYPAGSIGIVKSCWWSNHYGWRVTVNGGQLDTELSLQASDVTLINRSQQS